MVILSLLLLNYMERWLVLLGLCTLVPMMNCCVPISLEFMKAGIFLAEESLRHAEYIFSPSGLAAEGDAKRFWSGCRV